MTTPEHLRNQLATFGQAPLQELLYASVQRLVSEIYEPSYIARHHGLRRYGPVQLGGGYTDGTREDIKIIERMFHDSDGLNHRQGLIHLPAIPILALSCELGSVTESCWTALSLTDPHALQPAPTRSVAAGPSILPLFETDILGVQNPFTPSHRVSHAPSSLRWPTEAVRLNMEHSGLLGVAPPPFELKVTVDHGHGHLALYHVTMQQIEDPRVAMRTWPPLRNVHWHFTAQALTAAVPALSFVIEFS